MLVNPTCDVERIVEFNQTLNAVQSAIFSARRMRPGTSDELIVPVIATDSRSCDHVPHITSEARRHLSWSGEILGRMLRCDTRVAYSHLQAGMDDYEVFFNIDAEARSEELGKKLSYESMFPELFQDVGKLFD